MVHVGIRVVSDAYKMRAFLCDTRTWGRGSAPLERGHRPCRLSWDKKVVVSGLCHSRSFPGTLSDAAAGLLYLHQDTCSARLRLYSNISSASSASSALKQPLPQSNQQVAAFWKKRITKQKKTEVLVNPDQQVEAAYYAWTSQENRDRYQTNLTGTTDSRAQGFSQYT